MTLDIDIPDTKVANFSNLAKDELKTQINDISQKLVEEALRVESSERLKGDKQEVTSSVVLKSAELFLRRYNSKKGNIKRMCIEISSTIFITLSGIGFTMAFYDLQNNIWVLFIAIMLLVIGTITYVITIKNKYE